MPSALLLRVVRLRGWILMVSRLGRHAILDGSGVAADKLDSVLYLEAILRSACRAAGATVLKTAVHKFQPQGVTVLCLLAESHASIHTYPEHGVYMADIFTCGDLDPQPAVDLLRQQLGGEAQLTIISRPVCV